MRARLPPKVANRAKTQYDVQIRKRLKEHYVLAIFTCMIYKIKDCNNTCMTLA